MHTAAPQGQAGSALTGHAVPTSLSKQVAPNLIFIHRKKSVFLSIWLLQGPTILLVAFPAFLRECTFNILSKESQDIWGWTAGLPCVINNVGQNSLLVFYSISWLNPAADVKYRLCHSPSSLLLQCSDSVKCKLRT